jgi:hypothetical protein
MYGVGAGVSVGASFIKHLLLRNFWFGIKVRVIDIFHISLILESQMVAYPSETLLPTKITLG